MSRSRRNKSERGFSLLEVVVAITVLTIGLVSVAALATTMLATGKRSKYMALASTLASEKLEDLNRYPADAPQVCIPTGSTTEGAIGSDPNPAIVSITCPGGTSSTSVPYTDDVDISFGGNANCPSEGGCFAEQVSSVTNGTTMYSTTYHSPDGILNTTAASNTPSSQVMTFHRRWLIEGNTPVSGVRRITVQVVMVNNTVNPPVSFQMSTVRP